MRYLIVYHRRLGDIVQLFPACLHLSAQGHAVFFECDQAYHDIFACVDYVQPVAPGASRDGYDRVLELAIHPSSGGTPERYEAFRTSGRRWSDFVYDVPDIRGSYGRPKFTTIEHCKPSDYGLPANGDYVLLAPLGYSQHIKYEPNKLVEWCAKRWPRKRIFVLADAPDASFPPFVRARRLRDLPAIVSWPKMFASINTSTAIIAGGVRRQYIHFPQTGRAVQDDTAFAGVSEVVIPYTVAEPAPVPAPAPATSNLKVAVDFAREHDLTKIAEDSHFAQAIRRLFAEYKPRKIVETGTYLGTGTTRVIAQTVQALKIADARFYSIEINPAHYAQAQVNLRNLGCASCVKLLRGLSVPRALLPTVAEIQKSTVNQPEFEGIFVDHRETERAARYYAETNFGDGPEDLLGKVFDLFEGRPDFVLLDSGGRMRFVEFQYVVQRLKFPCLLALDDVYHIKHHKSLQFMRKDPRFHIIDESREKFGFCVARFDPTVPAIDAIVCKGPEVAQSAISI